MKGVVPKMNGEEIHSLLPPIMGLITVNQLGLQGWVKIPAYLMTYVVTREMIEQTENLTASPSAVAYTIVHTIPGRIRFHIPRLQKDKKYAQRLMRLAKAETRIKQARVNQDTASWVVTYQTGRNGSSQGNHQAIEVAELVKLIESAAMPSSPSRTSPEEIPSNSITTIPEIKPPEFWGNHGGVALTPNYEPQQDGLKPNSEPQENGLKPNSEPQEDGLKPNYKPMWTGCKASTLAVMLDLMANLPI